MQHLGSTIRISIFSLGLLAVIGITGCGASGSVSGSGGKGGNGGTSGGKAGASGAGGKGAAGEAGIAGGTGGVAGAPFGGGGGGNVGAERGGATGAAGTRGESGAAGSNPCGTAPSVCSAGARTCMAGVPQECVADLDGCASWHPLPACSTAQVCNAVTGACECRDDPACADPPTVGDFCPVEGAATHSTCVKGADGCYTVMTGVPCALDRTCNTDSPTTIVSQSVACGCPPPVGDYNSQGGALDDSVKLLGTGCTTAQAAASARIGSPGDDAVLTCFNTNSCPVWQIITNCATQQLTGGVDPLTTLPACVCRKPAKDGQYFVDPNPTMPPLMTGPPTGAQFPSACRFQTLTTALDQQSPPATEVIAQHEGSSNVHFRTKAGTPSVADCSAPNSCERFPMEIPAGVHLYTADVGSFNPKHYVIDVDQVTTAAGYALLLNDKVTLEGFTIDASATSSTGVNAGAGAIYVVASPAQGAWTGTPTVAPVTAALNQVRILGNAAGAPNGPVAALAPLVAAPVQAQTVLAVRGQAHWTANYLSIVAGAGTGRGILVNHATDAVTGSTATFTAGHLNVVLTGAAGATALGIGTNVADDAGNVVTVTNDATDHGTSALKVGDLGTAVLITGGTATFTGVDVGSTGGSLRGYDVWASNTPAGLGVTINQGSITAPPGTAGGMGVHVWGGLTTINGTHITGPQASVPSGGGPGISWVGVSVEQAPNQTGVAGEVTLTGTDAAKTIIETAPLALANATAVAGVVVGSGFETAASTRLPRLNITGNTIVTGHLDGVVVNNGRVLVDGSGVASTGNWRDGLQVFSTLNLLGSDPPDPPSRVAITGASFTANGRLGVLVRDIAPVALDGVEIVGNGGGAIAGNGLTFPNGTGGIDLQRSQTSGASGFLFNLLNSTVSGNVGCGVTLSGGDDTGVNRVSPADPGVRICGVGVSTTNVPGPVVAAVSSNPPMVSTPGALATNIGGKVSAVVRNNTIQNNSGVGIYITEARDFDPSSADDDVTEATVQGNTVTGNLTVVSASATEPAAGGIYVAASNFTNPVCPAASAGCTNSALSGVLTTDDLGCEDNVTSVDTSSVPPRKNHAACTRVTMSNFVGNTVACNGRAQLGYGIPQRATTSMAGLAWDISSNASIVGVTLADRCTTAATPNRVAGYSAGVATLGLVIPTSATDPVTLQSLVHVAAFGVFWNTSALGPGMDYSTSLGTAPRGNGDVTSWGVCPGATPVTCPVPVAP
jgi:hypothetical protein